MVNINHICSTVDLCWRGKPG